jgi:TonB family protein
MSLSDLCVQQHAHEQKRLRRLLLCGLAGSLAFHGIALTLGRYDLWQEPPDQRTPIELIVTEPPNEPRPAELSNQTNDPAAAAASAPPRAVMAAPTTTLAPPEAASALESPQPVESTQAESAVQESQSASPGSPFLSPGASGTGTAGADADAASTGGGSTPGARAGSNGRGQGRGSRTVACLDCVRPRYPESALAAGVEGQPRVSVDINPDGSVRSVTLIRSSGNPAIDQAVMRAARRSRFQPIAGGASVPIDYDLSIEGSRRHRDARRRGERQAVDLPPEVAPTAETADTPPAAATSAPSTPPVNGAAASPAQPSASPAPPAPEPAGSAPAIAPAPAPAPAPPATSVTPPAAATEPLASPLEP